MSMKNSLAKMLGLLTFGLIGSTTLESRLPDGSVVNKPTLEPNGGKRMIGSREFLGITRPWTDKERRKILTGRGMKEFNINGKKVWAINLKNAQRKAQLA